MGMLKARRLRTNILSSRGSNWKFWTSINTFIFKLVKRNYVGSLISGSISFFIRSIFLEIFCKSLISMSSSSSSVGAVTYSFVRNGTITVLGGTNTYFGRCVSFSPNWRHNYVTPNFRFLSFFLERARFFFIFFKTAKFFIGIETSAKCCAEFSKSVCRRI